MTLVGRYVWWDALCPLRHGVAPVVELTTSQFAVAAVLRTFMSDGGVCSVSSRRIAQLTGMHKETAGLALHELEAKGLVTIDRPRPKTRGTVSATLPLGGSSAQIEDQPEEATGRTIRPQLGGSDAKLGGPSATNPASEPRSEAEGEEEEVLAEDDTSADAAESPGCALRSTTAAPSPERSSESDRLLVATFAKRTDLGVTLDPDHRDLVAAIAPFLAEWGADAVAAKVRTTAGLKKASIPSGWLARRINGTKTTAPWRLDDPPATFDEIFEDERQALLKAFDECPLTPAQLAYQESVRNAEAMQRIIAQTTEESVKLVVVATMDRGQLATLVQRISAIPEAAKMLEPFPQGVWPASVPRLEDATTDEDVAKVRLALDMIVSAFRISADADVSTRA